MFNTSSRSVRRWISGCLVCLACTGLVRAAQTASPDPFEFTFSELAPGVWAGVRPDATRGPVMGNTMFVVTEVGVIVFDGGGLPLMSERLLEKITSVTDLPVTHVGISHWHGDHNFGIWAILERFPGAEVVAHPFTRAALLGSPAAYIDGYPDYVERVRDEYQAVVETGVDSEGTVISADELTRYASYCEHIDLLDEEYGRARVTVPTLTFERRLVLQGGGRTVEFLFLGAGNTAGDILMWLPDERIVATGDLVVHPVPFLYNVPPRVYSETLHGLLDLKFKTLVPGHGEIQHDSSYVELLLRLSDSIADQRDALLGLGLAAAEVPQELDFGEFEQHFTGGDEHLAGLFEVWVRAPFSAAAMKALTGEPMVVIGPRPARK